MDEPLLVCTVTAYGIHLKVASPDRRSQAAAFLDFDAGFGLFSASFRLDSGLGVRHVVPVPSTAAVSAA
ncbi:hypothetical protein GQ464_010800 [Rhodocaloribacter litoris]|uniref:hypothetical protein n=1 Tax=Rhodocaloribacter litoris TaxID=2558931 RepID=UPI0014226291|nr:hypothetical protein [Rhodocaloribacter litoris]QXD13946.1 hypothetical protein GQ464_010800 [Rhodocaloribacter litoris]